MPTRAEINAYNEEKDEVLGSLTGASRAQKDAAMESVINRRGLVDKFEGGGSSQWGGTVLANKTPSSNTPILPWDPESGDAPPIPMEGRPSPVIQEERPSLFTPEPTPKNRTTAFSEAVTDMILTNNPEEFGKNLEQRQKSRTVQNEMVDILTAEYEEDAFKAKHLASLSEMPPDEQLRVLEWYMSNRDWKAISAREALLIHVMRAGYSEMPVHEFNKLKDRFNATELDQFRLQLRNQQRQRLRDAFNDFAAKQNIDNAFLQVAQQDFVPFLNIFTRIGYNQTALEAADIKVHGLANILPGEMRQEMRSQFAAMSVDERIDFINQVGNALEGLKDGPYGPLITEYGLMEVFVETFTDDLLEENLTKNTLDRWFGNLDILFEGIYGLAILYKMGGRGIRSMYRVTDAVQARQAARVAGNQKLRAKLDRELGIIMQEAGEDTTEAAWQFMPRPPSLADDIDVLPDSLKDQIVLGDRLRMQILDKSDDVTGIALTTEDKVKAVRRTLRELEHDRMEVHPQMSVLEALPNDTGFKYTATYGKTSEGGWDNVADALDEALELDPELRHFRVMQRGPNGTLIEVGTDEVRIARSGVEADALDLSTLTDDELIMLSKIMEPDGDEFKMLEEEAMRRARGEAPTTGDALSDIDGEEYFLQMTHERYWSIIDKNALGASNWRNTGRLSQWSLTPSYQFGDEIFASFDRAYRIEQGSLAKFEQIYKPYYDLSGSDKRVVAKVHEWVESEAKRTGNIPNLAEINAEFDGLTTPQLGGYLAIQQGMNVQWEMFNRRLYRQWKTDGFMTARPVENSDMPRFHGKVLDKDAAPSKPTVYDPLIQEQRTLTKDELEDIYERGGAIMKLDTPMELSREKATTLILLDDDAYKIGKLDHEVLDYHPGYYSRFYDDPYFIIKKSDQEIDGGKFEAVEHALRTAGSMAQAERFLKRFAKFDKNRKVWVNKDDPAKTYRIQRSADLNQTESSLYTKDAIHREGRLFWDKRNADRLPDVNGNAAELEDPVLALDRSTTMAVRQNTQEDMIKAMKRAFFREYGDELTGVTQSDNLTTIIKKLEAQRRVAVEKELRKELDNAIAFLKYLRIQQGTDEHIVPALREGVVKLAGGISRIGTKFPSIESKAFKLSKVLENYASRMNPFRTVRSATFQAFMVFRPVRQLVLQAAQIQYLSGIDPRYVYTGAVLRDGLNVRGALMKATREGWNDGVSLAKHAKTMGLTQSQLKRLVNEMDRSGLLQTVDVHAFAGGARREKSAAGRNIVARGYGKTRDWMQSWGFDLGEQLNLSFTYMLALRRYMKQNNVDDLMKLAKDDWDKIATETQSLALGMTKPNKMWYQSGALGTMTQFLGFGHKALLGLFGANPAITGREAAKMAFFTYTMYGAGLFGAQEYIRGWAADKGIEKWLSREVPGGDTLYDVLTRGLVQKMLNTLMDATFEHNKDVDFSFLAPGVNVAMLWEEVVMGIVENPWMTFLGPSGSLFGDGSKVAWQFVPDIWAGTDDIPLETKVMRAADMVTRTMIPQYNDAMTVRQAYLYNQWFTRTGKALPLSLEPTLGAMLARVAVGARTVEEMQYWNASNSVWQTKENMRSIVKGNRDHLLKVLNLYHNGEIDENYLREQFQYLMAWSEGWPEHLRWEIYIQSLITKDQDGMSPVQLMAENVKFLKPNVIELLSDFEDIPPKERRELEEYLYNLYDERTNVGEGTQDYLRELDPWQN